MSVGGGAVVTGLRVGIAGGGGVSASGVVNREFLFPTERSQLKFRTLFLR
jgi:hypothetical protein